MSHVDTMIHLANQLNEEERVQNRIDVIRARNSGNNLVQLDLDRHQQIVDERKEKLEILMRIIANEN